MTDKIPSIAWTVPNIEAYARIQLNDVRDNELKACLQATLSNGWSTQRDSVKYASGFFTLATGLVGLLHALMVKSASPAIYRWFDVLYLFQTAAAGGMMHLNYPLAFTNFVQNFGWAFGLVYSAPMQHSITKMRNKTGGKLPGDAFNQVQYINRKLSPYNEFAVRPLDMTAAIGSPANFSSFVAKLPKYDGFAKRAQIPSLYEQTGAKELTTGLPVYSNSRGIAIANALDTVFFIFLAFLAIVIAFHVILGAIVFALSRGSNPGKIGRWALRLRRSWWSFCIANALRTCLIFFTPMFVLGFYQWTIGKNDSGLSIFFSILGMLMVFAPLVAACFMSLLVARRVRGTNDISPLYTNYRFYHAVGNALYRQYRQGRHYFWFAPLLLGMIARSGFIAFGHENPWAQVIGCLVVEFLILCCQLVLHPYTLHPKERRSCVRWCRERFRFPMVLTLFRMIYFGLCVAFLQSIGLKPIPRTVIGIIQIAVIGIPVVLLLIATIYNLGHSILWRKNSMQVEHGAALNEFDSGLSQTDSNDTKEMTNNNRFSNIVTTDTSAPGRSDMESGYSHANRKSYVDHADAGQDYTRPRTEDFDAFEAYQSASAGQDVGTNQPR